MDHNLNERQINLPMANINTEQNGYNGNGNGNGYTNNNINFAISNGLCMNNRDPIDLQFKDVTYTVNLGFNKGKTHLCAQIQSTHFVWMFISISGFFNRKLFVCFLWCKWRHLLYRFIRLLTFMTTLMNLYRQPWKPTHSLLHFHSVCRWFEICKYVPKHEIMCISFIAKTSIAIPIINIDDRFQKKTLHTNASTTINMHLESLENTRKKSN